MHYHIGLLQPPRHFNTQDELDRIKWIHSIKIQKRILSSVIRYNPVNPVLSWILKWRGFSLFRFRSPLLTESLSISLPPVTEMFHFTGCRDASAMNSQKLERVLARSGYPIRKFTGQSVFAALRDLSQLTTSFIAYWHQGIHDALFVA